MLTETADGAATIIGSLKNWSKQPFTQDMTLWRWFVFTGLVLVAATVWVMILRELKGELLS